MLGAVVLSPETLVREKICAKCGYLKPLEKFPHSKYNIDGLYSYCKECARSSSKYYYAKRTGRTVEQLKVDKANRIVKIFNGKKICAKCKKWKSISRFDKNINKKTGLQPSCVDCRHVYYFKENRRIKLICMIGYGGRCSCCGDNRIEMLTVEHIRNKGHKLMYDGTLTLMKKLIRLNFPDGYTCLCYGCNSLTRHGKPCVHSKEWKEYYSKNIEPYKYIKEKELNELENKWAMMNLVKKV